jgi:CheY-like chemotaxis protein
MSASQTQSGARIVVADDEDDIRRLVSFMLKRRGHQIFEAANGEDALALIVEHRPDLVVLDVMMPGMTGPEVARQMQANARISGIPVLLVSAMGQGEEIARGLASGAAGYLVKPFKPQDLTVEVNRLLDQGVAS